MYEFLIWVDKHVVLEKQAIWLVSMPSAETTPCSRLWIGFDNNYELRGAA